MISPRDYKNFAEEVLMADTLLGEAVDWISNNLNPEEVFEQEALHSWALDNDYTLAD